MARTLIQTLHLKSQRQEYKLIQKGRQSRLTEDRIGLLDKIDFVWEAQRGGPRRKRKATVAVPPKANPVDAEKVRAKATARGKLVAMLGNEHPNFVGANHMLGRDPSGFGSAQQQQIMALAGQNWVANGGGTTAKFSASQPWQVLSNGAFQSTMSSGVALPSGSSMFPLASPFPGMQQGQVGNNQQFPFIPGPMPQLFGQQPQQDSADQDGNKRQKTLEVSTSDEKDTVCIGDNENGVFDQADQKPSDDAQV